MKMNKYACIIVWLFFVIISCNKETELTSSPNSPSSSPLLQQPTSRYFIGEQFGGGIIFYIDKTGKHGLIAAAADFEEPASWSRKDTLNGAKDTALGAGLTNTNKIYKVQGNPQYEADNYAALECLELTLNGYGDWYLPSLNELGKMYLNKTIIGGFHPYTYWSSSEWNATSAWLVNFNDGSQTLQDKIASYTFRPTRKF